MDRFAPGGPAAAPGPAQPAAAEPIPDARRIAADPTLRYLDLNMAITESYGVFGRRFQEIVDPAFDGGSAVMPNWYAVAAFASRSAGGGLRACDAGLAVLAAAAPGVPTADLLRRACPQAGPVAEAAGAVIDELFGDVEKRLAAAVLVATLLVEGIRLSDLLDPAFLLISVSRLASLVQVAPGPDLRERLAAVVQTTRNTLEDGNRRIFADIGVAGQDYLEWRGRLGRRPRPAEVLAGFRPQAPAQAREMYAFALRAARGHGPLPTNLGRRFPASRYDLGTMLVAGFALYEKAGQTADPRVRARCVDMANVLLAWREQFETVQPAFMPPVPLPGEVDRERTFEVVTPQVSVAARWGTWSYRDFVEGSLPDRDGNPWTPRITEHNWAHFEDRWAGILDYFGQVGRSPEGMWPMPDPDPARPMATPPPTTPKGDSLDGWLVPPF